VPLKVMVPRADIPLAQIALKRVPTRSDGKMDISRDAKHMNFN
jgi:hypothetical protein